MKVCYSTRSGMGKSLYIQQLVDELNAEDCYHIIPLHGPRMDANILLKAFSTYLEFDTIDPCVYHIDISQTVRILYTCILHCLTLFMLQIFFRF